MGPLPTSRSGHAYLLVMQDLFTKWIECCPLRKATGRRIREAIEEMVIFRWGTPRVLLTDNGTEFLNRDLRAMSEQYGIYQTTVPPYHPQANPVERVNRVLKTMITAYPRLSYGREPLPVGLHREQDDVGVEIEEANPVEWREHMGKMGALREWVAENLEAAQERQSKYYNRHRREVTFNVGEQVLKRYHVLSAGAQHFSAKLVKKFHGPFIIRRILSPVVYELADLTGGKVVGKVLVKDLKQP
ncbi:protein NYNRIN-like [Solenopsis invicta]|uniref:protein NYNRIN-like n=1 Tax=Solenopsis invicta TaxID=13686 RepID=UPI00193EB5F6|nr:protein NYNRIN-like [Solenopsis invicta]